MAQESDILQSFNSTKAKLLFQLHLTRHPGFSWLFASTEPSARSGLFHFQPTYFIMAQAE